MDELLKRYRLLMTESGLGNEVIETFIGYLEQLIAGETGCIGSSSIQPPKKELLERYESLTDDSTKNLDKLALIKLNGGLGTSMGLDRAKSLIRVRNNYNFLDIISLQTLTLRHKTKCHIPLIFMNSFNTDNDTLNYLRKYRELKLNNLPLSFMQNKYPRVRQDTFQPYQHPNDEKQNWNPPGHGDIYQTMKSTSILQSLLDSGIQYAFISNTDNLGAVVDKRILNYMVDNRVPFLMEVCRREPIDKKGGHLAQTEKGLILREIAQCPQEELDMFQDIDLYRYFNTNNIWVNLEYMKRQVESKGFRLPIIVNAKSVEGTNVYQIETAMGAAISLFPGSKGLIVPRKRFSPVKKTSDLLIVRSDCYMLTGDYLNILNPECMKIPLLELDDRYYKTIKQLEKHFPHGTPSLKKCNSLKVNGDITFGKNVSFTGDVDITADNPITLTDDTFCRSYRFS